MTRPDTDGEAPGAVDGARVLLVDDQPANLDVLCALLEKEGYRVLLARDGASALRTASRRVPDVVLLDVVMPGMDGYEVCRRLRQQDDTRDVPVIFVTARDEREDILRGFEAGGVDYVTKPLREEEVLVRVGTHVRLHRVTEALRQANLTLREEIAQRRSLSGRLSAISDRENERWGLEGFVGRSPTIQQIFADIRRLQESDRTSVLITGESGTGKELIARALHYGSARREAAFVPLNCAAMPGDLIESLLFGHVRGAFTGADGDRVGHFEMAHGGTLFLDEVGEMPLLSQAKLLRVLEDGRVRPVGAGEDREVDVRVVAATNVELTERIGQGRFRQDLYYRLARFVVTAPPLRERAEDIPPLAQHFLQLFGREMGREVPPLEAAVLEQLAAYAFPGNVRELKNVMERALIESSGGPIRTHHLHFAPQAGALAQTAPAVAPPPRVQQLPLDLDRASVEAQAWVVRQVMDQVGGNVSEAARLLGASRNRIYRVLASAGDSGLV